MKHKTSQIFWLDYFLRFEYIYISFNIIHLIIILKYSVYMLLHGVQPYRYLVGINKRCLSIRNTLVQKLKQKGTVNFARFAPRKRYNRKIRFESMANGCNRMHWTSENLKSKRKQFFTLCKQLLQYFTSLCVSSLPNITV